VRIASVVVAAVVLAGSMGYGQEYGWHRVLSGRRLTVGINPRNPNTVYASGLSVSRDRGETWTTLGTPASDELRQILVHPSDTLVIFALGFFGGIQRSSDGGVTWNTALDGVGIDGESLCTDPLHPDTLFFGNFSDGSVFKSTDRGVSWTLVSSPGGLLCAMAVRPDSAEILYAGTGNGTISKSNDGGVSWRQVKEGGSAEIPKIVIDPADPMVAYGTGYDGDVAARGVWKTTDGGESWFLAGLTDLSLWAMDLDQSNPATIYAGLFSAGPGVYETTDGGSSWSLTSAGLQLSSNAWSIKVHPMDPGLVWLAAGDGLYRRVQAYASVTGAVLDGATGDTVRNGTLVLASTGQQVDLGESGGLFSVSLFEGDSLQPNPVHIEAFPYFFHDEEIGFVADTTIVHDLHLTRLPAAAIQGVVRDSLTGGPVAAEIRVLTTTSVGPDTITATANPDGTFLIDSLYITYPPLVSYTGIRVFPEMPHADLSYGPFVFDSTGLFITADSDTADVLLTSSAGAGDYSDFFGRALDSVGVSYHFWNRATSGPAPLSRTRELRKPLVLFYSGIDTQPLPDSELDSLSAATASGLPLFLTGQNFIEANESSEFVSQTLRLIRSGSTGSNVAFGTNGDLLSDIRVFSSGGLGANNQTSRDILQIVGSDIFPVLGYGFLGSDGIAGVRIENIGTGGRIVVFGFGFEAINLPASAEEVMGRVIGYLDGSITVGVDVDPPGIPAVFGLGQNYPNPFNPQTSIRFSIAADGPVSLVVYDLLGERVTTLVQEELAPGEYDRSFDATGLASGLYFYRLTSAGSVATRKMMILR